MAVIVAMELETMFEGVAGRGRFAAAARSLWRVSSFSKGDLEAYLDLTVSFCEKLKKAQVAMTAQIPNQKFLAYMLPSTWNSVSSRISPKNVEACVTFEKSTPDALRGEPESAPPII
jgi:hypothetical protein